MNHYLHEYSIGATAYTWKTVRTWIRMYSKFCNFHKTFKVNTLPVFRSVLSCDTTINKDGSCTNNSPYCNAFFCCMVSSGAGLMGLLWEADDAAVDCFFPKESPVNNLFEFLLLSVFGFDEVGTGLLWAEVSALLFPLLVDTTAALVGEVTPSSLANASLMEELEVEFEGDEAIAAAAGTGDRFPGLQQAHHTTFIKICTS